MKKLLLLVLMLILLLSACSKEPVFEISASSQIPVTAAVQSVRNTVRICVIDSGAEPTEAEVHSYLSDDGSDTVGHGTQVLSCIREYAPEAELVMLKCFDDAVDRDRDNLLIRAVTDAADLYHADILLTAWTVPGDNEELHSAFIYAYNQGVLCIAPTGNVSPSSSLFSVAYPAAYTEVLAVGGVDIDKNGEYVENMLYKTGEYMDFTMPAEGGTSFAAARLAGLCAAYLNGKPTMTPDEIHEALILSAVDLGEPGRDEVFGWGVPQKDRLLGK